MQSFFSGKKILITGASGFIGSRLAKELIDHGAILTAIARKNANLWRLHGYVDSIEWLYPEQNDIDDLTRQVEKANPELIYHLATYYSVDSNVDISEIIDTNIKLGALLVKAASNCQELKLFINAGTCAEYGDIRGDANEDSLLAPNSIYASTKASSTLIIHQLARDLKVPLTTLRLYNLYGEFEDPKRIVPHIVLSLLRGKDVDLTGCEQLKDYSYIGDMVDAFLMAATAHEKAADEIYNIGSGHTIKMRQLVEEIAANIPDSRSKINFGALPYRENEMWHQSTATGKAANDLCWQSETDLRSGVKKTVDWYKANYKKYYE